MLLIGLWNSMIEYRKTVHNLGQLAVLELIKDLDSVFPHLIKKKKSIFVQEKYTLIRYRLGNGIKLNLLLLLGCINSTGFNLVNAGEEIDEIKENEEIVALYDDVGINTGQVIVSYAKGSSRHNGVTGLDQHINRNYWRIRLGITKPKELSTKDFVLQKLDQKNDIRKVIVNLSYLMSEKLTEPSKKGLTEKRVLELLQNNINQEFKGSGA